MKLEIDTTQILKKALAERGQDLKTWKQKTIEKNLGQVFDSKSPLRKKIDEMILEQESELLIKNYLKSKGIDI